MICIAILTHVPPRRSPLSSGWGRAQREGISCTDSCRAGWNSPSDHRTSRTARNRIQLFVFFILFFYLYKKYGFNLSTLRKLCFHFLSHWMGYDPGDSFPFNFEPNGIPFGSNWIIKWHSIWFKIQRKTVNTIIFPYDRTLRNMMKYN